MNPLEARRRLLGRNVYKRTTEGNPAIAQGSLARRYPGITMQGWTEQAQTTGINMYNNDISDYRKLVDYYIFNLPLKQGKYKIKARKKGVDVLGAVVGCVESGEFYKEFVNQRNCIAIDGEAFEISFTLTEDKNDFKLAVYIEDISQWDDIIKNYDIQLSGEDGFYIWEPYTGRKPSPSPEYPQEIVSAGKYNEDTQKWEYEITIANAQTDATKNQTVTLTSDRPLTKWDKLEKRNGQWGWVYKSAEIESYTDESVPGEYYSTTGQLSVGAQVWYETTTETFAPLSESEQEAMNALHTYRPTTVLSNQQGCQMALTYKTRKSMEVTA